MKPENLRQLGGAYSVVADVLWYFTILIFSFIFVWRWSRVTPVSGQMIYVWLTVFAALPSLFLTVLFNGLSARWGYGTFRRFNFASSVIAVSCLSLMVVRVMVFKKYFPDLSNLNAASTWIDIFAVSLLVLAALYAWYDLLFQQHPAFQSSTVRAQTNGHAPAAASPPAVTRPTLPMLPDLGASVHVEGVLNVTAIAEGYEVHIDRRPDGSRKIDIVPPTPTPAGDASV